MSTPLPGLESAGEPGPGLAGLFTLRDAPVPWLPGGLPADLAADLDEQLHAFTGWLNAVYAVNDDQLIPPCWPQHPGLVHDLAALWATWLETNQGLAATGEKALDFHERRLPAFHARLGTHLGGRAAERCSMAGHKPGWRPAAAHLPAAPAGRPPLLHD